MIDEHKEKIIGLSEDIYNQPELGYKEFETTRKVSKAFEELGLDVEKDIAITGCKTTLKGKQDGPNVALMGELDAVVCHEHPDANKETGAVHACGHNAQVGSMFGAAIGLIASGVIDELTGSITFMGVPAEEFVELEFREQLMDKNQIKYFGGKQELIYRGYFDDIDISLMCHLLPSNGIVVGPTGNGFIGKKVQFIGKESHAGAMPEGGINALNAANLSLAAINAQRETFPDEDNIRVHPIITKGGDLVNIVPADVRLESYVRGNSIEGIKDANKKVNKALKAGAMGVGADVKITELPGFLPLIANDELSDICYDNAIQLVDKDKVEDHIHMTGSFDFGDISHIMPSLHPLVGGVSGDLHTREFQVVDKELSYITSAKLLVSTLIDLLSNQAEKGNQILKDFQPKLTKKEYLSLQEEISKEIYESYRD
ncbi:amidohydrolase [Natranaerobius trueperi]|uniref:Peptidase M20 domain-containing protein 2 n=1 Tax=Natranaerobius trueperi TaxID=759412 RepID=A0A226C1C2_9FIRM|nr:amidohydrolase [Natranaerobius trueperi]